MQNDGTQSLLKLLGISVLVISGIYILANLFDQEQFPITENLYPTDIFFVILPIFAIIVGFRLSRMYGGRGNHGIAWMLFTMAISIWFVGEMTYSYDQEYDVSDISTFTSDIFYILGYLVFFAFTIFYLKPRKKLISKEMTLVAIGISILLLIPSLYVSLDFEEEPLFLFIYGIYPVLDSMILAPSVIAVMMFLRGKVNLLWGLILFSIIFDVVSDTLYFSESITKSYYPGHPLDILSVLAYLFYIFGGYSHIRLFKKNSQISS